MKSSIPAEMLFQGHSSVAVMEDTQRKNANNCQRGTVILMSHLTLPCRKGKGVSASKENVGKECDGGKEVGHSWLEGFMPKLLHMRKWGVS